MIDLAIKNEKSVYLPGDMVECEYKVTPSETDNIQAIETSVLWFTTGKGDEDIGVHFFKRRLKREMTDNELEKVHRFSVELPRTPLSYEGLIVQIQWVVRVRLFFKKGVQQTFDAAFRLGDVDPPKIGDQVDYQDSESADEEE